MPLVYVAACGKSRRCCWRFRTHDLWGAWCPLCHSTLQSGPCAGHLQDYRTLETGPLDSCLASGLGTLSLGGSPGCTISADISAPVLTALAWSRAIAQTLPLLSSSHSAQASPDSDAGWQGDAKVPESSLPGTGRGGQQLLQEPHRQPLCVLMSPTCSQRPGDLGLAGKAAPTALISTFRDWSQASPCPDRSLTCRAPPQAAQRHV